jgi:hypothetical protein
LDSDTYWLWHDRLGHPGRDMMLRILKTSHGHPFFRVRRSKNRKLIPGLSKTATIAASGAAAVLGRHRAAQVPCDDAINGANHEHDAMVVPPSGHDATHTNFHGSNAIMGDVVTHFASNSATDAQAQPKSSLVASKASRSFYKACSLGKLGLRPSYAKDMTILIMFLHRIRKDSLDSFTQLADV